MKVGFAERIMKSLENGRTSALFPESPKTDAWPPTTTMLAWESNCVEVSWSSLVPMSARVAQIAAIFAMRCGFGLAVWLPQVDDLSMWEPVAGVQPDFPGAFAPMLANFSMRADAQRSAIPFSLLRVAEATFAPARWRRFSDGSAI